MKTFDFHSLFIGQQLVNEPTLETAEIAWRPLYRVGAMAALSTVALILLAIPAYLIWPPPGNLLPTSSNVIDFFKLMQKNWLVGLLGLDLIMVASAVLMIPIYLALYASLRRASQSFMAIALALGLVGVAAYFAANPAFTMLFLSARYAGATGDAQSGLVAAGQAILANYQGTGFDVYYILGAVALLIISAVMLRSTIFGKVTAYLGIVTGILMLVPPTAGTIGLYFSWLSLLPLAIWYVLIARRLFLLGRSVSKSEARRLAVS